MKQTKNNIRKINILFFLLVSLSAIIFIIIKTIADDNLNMRQVRYQLGSTVNYEFSFYTDSPKFHTKASGYDKYKGMDTENNMNSIVATDMVKMQGYGNYEFKPDTNLFSFIDYCYSKDPATTMACAYRAGTTEANTWDYTKLMSYRDSSVNTSFFKYFWQNMSNLCPNFKDYQDDFFFLHYTYPATQKIGINLAMMRNLRNDGESLAEYLTCLTSYIFSITQQAQVNGMTFGKGDVVPFLYYKDRKHANIDVRHDSEALMDIAKYAYVALIEGWCTLPTPYHLWENEYNFIFGNYEPENLDYDLETLHQWYDETYQRYCKDKGRKGNNLLGSTIEHIIESDYSIEQQLEATEHYLRAIFSDLGIETDFKETMARNELMAKYMMQHSNFDETIKNYNVTIDFMTENLQRGTHEEQNTHTVVTSDFQTLEFPYTMDKRNVNHSDEDGISDGQELGNEKWINITAFVKRTYEEAVRNGDPHKATFKAQVEDIIEKNGAYTDFGGNKVYGSVKWNDDKTKVLYRVYDYKSNPKLNDTDFDGIWDNSEKEGFKLDNKFVGGTIIENGNMPIEYYNDFRWFMTSPNKYNDELSVMSLIMSNLANAKTISINQLNLSNNLESFLGYLGFDSIHNKERIKLDEAITLNANVYIGYKEIKYYDVKKTVYGVFIGGLDNNKAYRKLVINNNDEEIVQYYNYIANDIINYLNSNLVSTANDVCYWVTGKGIAGAVANIVAKELISNGNETFCYTFGAPQNSLDGEGAYNSIYNIINEDDLIPKLFKSNDKFSKYGEKYNSSIYIDFMREYKKLFDINYEGNYRVTNNISVKYARIRELIDNDDYYDRLSQYLYNGGKLYELKNPNTVDIDSIFEEYKQSIAHAKQMKAYYTLAKSLDGFNLSCYKREYDEIQPIISSDFNDNKEHLFIEIDYVKGFEPSIKSLQMVVDAFYKHDIVLHIDAGPYSINYNNKSESDEIIGLLPVFAEFKFTWKMLTALYFKEHRRGRFFHCLYINKFIDRDDVLGLADDIPGMCFIAAKGQFQKNNENILEAVNFMHELGHVLGLHHGGDEDLVYKPNYLSIMNYLYSNYGLEPNNVLDYSNYELPEIPNTRKLDENRGIDPIGITKNVYDVKWKLIDLNTGKDKDYKKIANKKPSIDFNKNGKIDESARVNFYIPGYCNFIKKSINDWEYIVLKPKKEGNFNTENINNEFVFENFRALAADEIKEDSLPWPITNKHGIVTNSNDRKKYAFIEFRNYRHKKYTVDLIADSPIFEKKYNISFELPPNVVTTQSVVRLYFPIKEFVNALYERINIEYSLDEEEYKEIDSCFIDEISFINPQSKLNTNDEGFAVEYGFKDYAYSKVLHKDFAKYEAINKIEIFKSDKNIFTSDVVENTKKYIKYDLSGAWQNEEQMLKAFSIEESDVMSYRKENKLYYFIFIIPFFIMIGIILIIYKIIRKYSD